MKMSRTNVNHRYNLDIPSGATRGTSSLKTCRRIPRAWNRSRNQVAEEITLFYCPYCDFASYSQMKIGDHVVDNHVDENIERNAQAPDIIECNLCFAQVTNGKMLEQHVRSEHPDVLVV